MKYLILFCGIAGVLLLYMLSSASANTDLFSQNYFNLLILTGTLVFGLSGLVIYQSWQLRNQLRERVYGAKLTLRLALFFTLIAVLPGVMVYAVSVQFLNKSIESWFDVRVEKALEGGLNLARSTLQNGLEELDKKGRFVSLILAEQDPNRFTDTLKRIVAEGGVQEAVIYDGSSRVLAMSGRSRLTGTQTPTSQMLKEAWKTGKVSRIDALPDESLVLRVLVPIRSERWPMEMWSLQFSQVVPRQLSADAQTVQDVNRDYQQLSLSRVGLKRLYGITLTLSLLIVLLSVISAAIFLSAKLSSPLAALAEGTRAVAKGDFSSSYTVQSDDELGALTGLFNQMTAQLASAKELSERQQHQVESTKSYLESVLAHLSSGVLVVDENLNVRSTNASASQILGISVQEMSGRGLQELANSHALLRSFVGAVNTGLESEKEVTWQLQVERMSKNGDQVLLIRGTRLTADSDKGYVVVFDDITHLLQAERQAAWGEVARRLAHEIKNPLTPIQLSAERLQHKLHERLEGKDAQLLQRATDTIVSQVAALKNMVADFADYARAPAPKLLPLDLHQLLNEVMGLYEANSSPITMYLNATRTRINGDATRLRQVVHNLLQNAHDALQQTQDSQIILSTKDTQQEMFLMTIADNGCGFSEHLLARAFEPYMTSKPKGTGLGLPIVKKIVEEHGGRITIENREHGGTCVNVLLPLIHVETEVTV